MEVKVLVKHEGGQWIEVANQDTPGLRIEVAHLIFGEADEYGSKSLTSARGIAEAILGGTEND